MQTIEIGNGIEDGDVRGDEEFENRVVRVDWADQVELREREMKSGSSCRVMTEWGGKREERGVDVDGICVA